MSKNLSIILLLITLAVGLIWELSPSSSVEQETSSGVPERSGSFPGNVGPRRSLPGLPGSSIEGQPESPGFGSAPGWEDRTAKKRSAPPVEQREEETEADDEEDLNQLIQEALHAPDPDDRSYAFGELALWDVTPAILTACLEGLGDPEEEVREAAVMALEMLEDPSVIPDLERVAQEDPSEDVREAAADTIEYLAE